MTCKSVFLGVALLASCGNYSNEDLEFMNAVPATADLTANMPRSNILPANEAELSRLTHDVIRTFNLMLDQILGVADVIRMYQPTGRAPNQRIWGPVPADKPSQLGWQWRFRVTRDPATSDYFEYFFEIQRIGAAPDDWLPFIHGDFEATSGVRRGTGMVQADTQMLRDAGFPFDDSDGTVHSIMIRYSTREYPISVVMEMVTLPKPTVDNPSPTVTTIKYEYGQQETGQGAMGFSGTDSEGKSIAVVTRWLASGQGIGQATWMDGLGASFTRTECWDDSFRETYDNTPWDPSNLAKNSGDPSFCPAIPTL